MVKLDYADYKFTVKEGSPSVSGADDAPVSLCCEPITSELSIVGSGYLSIHLKKGISCDDAQEIAKNLEQWIEKISYVKG